MTKHHSRNTRYYLHSYDINGQGSAISLPLARDMMDATAFNDTGEKNVAGPGRRKFTLDSLYDDNAADQNVDAALDYLRSNPTLLTIFPGGDALGQYGYSGPGAMSEGTSYTSKVADIVRMVTSGTFGGYPGTVLSDGEVFRVQSLAPYQTVTATFTGTALDGGAQTTLSRYVYIHFPLLTATGGNARWQWSIEDSADGATGWAAIAGIGFPYNLAAPQATWFWLAGTVKRYTRVVMTRDATSGSISFQSGIQRQ